MRVATYTHIHLTKQQENEKSTNSGAALLDS